MTGSAIPNPGNLGAPGGAAQAQGFDFDAIVVGTGFGGAVTACRLAQAGLRVCVLERGRRYALSDLPALPQPNEFMPDSRRWTWSGSQGLWDIRNLEGVMVAQAAAYGGGSLVYANVHLRPPRSVFGQEWPVDCQHRTRALDEYFDLAAYMLQVAPIPVPWRGIGKTGAMSNAFRQAVGPAGVFFPPLAIQFPENAAANLPVPPDPPVDESQLPPNIHGRPQGPCQRCGACDLGCRYGAKNTLDRNYLALAEKSGNVTVRTLAEALMISPFQGGYRVDYCDHLTETKHQLTARYLFLCAGAINTTELVLRSVAQGAPNGIPDPTLGPGLPHAIGGVGHDYFVNADSLAMVLDTQQVVGPSAGPVITTALIHSQRRPDQELHRRRLRRHPQHPQQERHLDRREWFMIQDGGYPKEVARFFATFGSPFLFGRNRFDAGGPPPQLIARGGLPRMGRPDRYSTFLEGAYAALRDGTLPDLLPRDFQRARTSLTATVRQWWHEFLADASEAVRNEVVITSPIFRFFQWVRLTRIGWFRRGLSRFLVAAMGGQREHLLADTVEAGAHRFGADDPTSIPARIGHLLLGEGYPVEDPKRGPPLHSPPSPPRLEDHRSLLLAMGRDDVPATISRHPETERLEVTFQDDAFRTLADEERVMRDVATALGGTLRNSPVWAFARQPITAHSHGGCGLGVVTDNHGQVHNYPSLYINDGSLLPSPVGVNPSATIAAIAERNMEHFVTNVIGQASVAWRQTKLDAIDWVARQRENGAVFEPPDLGNAAPAAPEVVVGPPNPDNGAASHLPIGVAFRETMSGFLSHVNDEDGLLPDPQKARVPVPPFLTGEGAANAAAVAAADPRARVANFNCQAQLLDIGAFLDDPNHVIALHGSVTIPEGVLRPGSPRALVEGVVGQLHLLADATSVRRTMNYYLPFDFEGQRFTLVGHKEVEDDPGFDAWLDAATLYTEIYRGDVAPLPAPALDPNERTRRRRALPVRAYGERVVARGILRLGIMDFLTNQIQGLGAAGTDDPARVVWTLGSFGLYFFGTIQRAYSPQIERFLDLFSRSGWRTQATPLGLMKGL